jgi:hypothetical protein
MNICGDDDGDRKKYFWQGQQASQAARVSSHTSRVSHLLLFLHSSLGESTVLNLNWTTTRLAAFLQPSTWVSESLAYLGYLPNEQLNKVRRSYQPRALVFERTVNKVTMEEARGRSGAREESLGENLAVWVDRSKFWISSYGKWHFFSHRLASIASSCTVQCT